MWAARHLSERQQRKFVGAGGSSKLRLPKEDAAKRRAAERQKELKRARGDYADRVPVRIGAEDASHPDDPDFSIWDWAQRQACQVCSRKPVVRPCGKRNRLACGNCCSREPGRHRWLCLECGTPSDESTDQTQLLVSVLNQEVKERIPIISVPPSDGPSEMSASMAKRIIGDAGRADEFAWPAQMKAKDWGLSERRPKIPMSALLKHFPEKREAWTGVERKWERPSASSSKEVIKEEPRSGSEERKSEGKVVPTGLTTPSRGRSQGPVQPPPKRARGSTSRALEVAASETLMAEARMNLSGLVYAKSTASSKEAKGKLYVQLAEARNLQPFPVTPEVLMEVAAVLRAADFSSGIQYLTEAKQLHVRQGFDWNERLEVCLQDADRALARALGPTRKAEEVRPTLWAEWLKKPKEIPRRSTFQPGVGPEVWGFASAFLLREVELAHLVMESVSFDHGKKNVTLLLSMSKTDPSGRGARRTRSCNCRAGSSMRGCMDCPYHSSVEVVATQHDRLRSLNITEEAIKRSPVVGQKGAPQLIVSKEAMIATMKMDAEQMILELTGRLEHVPRPDVNHITGHTMRRSGAKDAVRRHQMPLAMVQWLGRWGSEAVKGYVEEALEEMPEVEVQLTTWQGLTEKALKVSAKQQKLELMVEELKEKSRLENDEVKAILEELKTASKPPMVMNRATSVLHATAPKESPEWKESPVLWTTRCGLWRWGIAGRLAKGITAAEQVKDALVICSKCRHVLIEEGFLAEQGWERVPVVEVKWSGGIQYVPVCTDQMMLASVAQCGIKRSWPGMATNVATCPAGDERIPVQWPATSTTILKKKNLTA